MTQEGRKAMEKKKDIKKDIKKKIQRIEVLIVTSARGVSNIKIERLLGKIFFGILFLIH